MASLLGKTYFLLSSSFEDGSLLSEPGDDEFGGRKFDLKFRSSPRNGDFFFIHKLN